MERSPSRSAVTPRIDAAYGRRLAISISYYIAFIALGLTTASLGPTLKRLAENTGTEIGQITFLFTARSFGYMIGSFIGGQLTDRLPGNSLLGVTIILVALAMVAVPGISLLYVLLIVLFAIGICEGAVDVGGNALLVWLHRDQVGPFMNALHFFFGIGAFLSPIIIARVILATDSISWAYWTLALLIFPVSLWLLRLPSPVQPTLAADDPNGRIDKPLLVMVFFFFLLYVAAEVSYGGLIATFVSETGLGDEVLGSYLTAAFWGALTVGRLLSIPLAARFRPRAILLTDLIGCLASVGLLLLWQQSLLAIWIGSLGLGLFMASIFPTTISLAERTMPVTGQVASVFLIGAALGGMTLPLLIGQLFTITGPMVVMMAIFAALVAAFLLYFLLITQADRVRAGRRTVA